MKFAELHNIKLTNADDWFDPVLTIDTKLFIDPFLIYAQESSPFNGSHNEVIGFFNDVFVMVARSGGNHANIFWRRALEILIFPEVQELCLGYASQSISGSGSGRGFSKLIAEALQEAINRGVRRFEHFEEVDILGEGIGADRISDITANILRRRFATYTGEICKRHSIQMKEYPYNRAFYDVTQHRWAPSVLTLPENPNNGRPMLLVPRRYLRELPTINADSFWNYCFDNENQILRDQYTEDISRHVNKKQIVEFARKHPEVRARYIRYAEGMQPEPYDATHDPKGLIAWYAATAAYCSSQPKTLNFKTEAEFILVILDMIEEFRNYVENNGGWQLLWNDNHVAKGEQAVQLLFLGIVKHYCKANNIDISPETNIGRGPVDFKITQGATYRALLEVKLARNSRFWDGLEKQLPKYQEAEGIIIGYFLVIGFNDSDFEKVSNIEDRVAMVNKATGYRISSRIVDASRNPPSASKL